MILQWFKSLIDVSFIYKIITILAMLMQEAFNKKGNESNGLNVN